MARDCGTFTVLNSEYRTCRVGKKKALFHRWIERAQIVPPSPMVGGHGGGVIRATFGIVEYEDGKVAEIDPERIQFIDGLFAEFAFTPEEK